MVLYGSANTTFGEFIELLSYQVEAGKSYRVKTFIGWGDTAGEFEVYVNDLVRAGCRTSDEKRTEQVWWGDTFILNENDEITVLGTHYVTGLRNLKCNLELTRLS